ncbi:galactokinase [Anaerosalibacter sp. Marseille-P3206]|uniref:galactokinase n=1 Tax=Anaerosalibacter sp. Marseille-P3206 TaxID=1871005 RepID=UPI00098511F0|nr:galactokinase [Anaerosalibacter sp. Marseille-P3206]
MDIANFKDRFCKLYGDGEVRTFFSPSRVNLIGEHIDYNGGYVLPCALEMGTFGCVRGRSDRKIRLASENFDLKVEVNIDELEYEVDHGWTNYPKGVIYYMKESGYKVSGMDILVYGNIPNGAGLSSSASLELLVAEMINNLFNDGDISKLELVKISQRAENDFVGVKCGIMDQFAVAMGRVYKAMLLDCDSLKYRYINMNIKDYKLVIMNTKKRRELNDSKYNERRDECEKALSIINKYKYIDNLCQLSLDGYLEVEKYIDEEYIRNRARHVICENQRVLKACEALENEDIFQLGQLFIESHNSLRDLYEVTGMELDTIVQAAIAQKGCIGARMTGAGFGGCAIALVEKKSVDNFINRVGEIYNRKIGYKAEFYLTGIGDGTREI